LVIEGSAVLFWKRTFGIDHGQWFTQNNYLNIISILRILKLPAKHQTNKMISEKENTKISKFLSLVLRHQPGLIGINLDENGWVDIDMLLLKSKTQSIAITKEILNHVVETNAKKRFSIDGSANKIRANQGHSIDVSLGYAATVPPEILFHGTSEKSVDSIFKTGIEKRERHHVHLSSNIETAINVGKRHGKPAVFKVLSGKMHAGNFDFFLSENGVWLTAHVPARFVEIERNNK